MPMARGWIVALAIAATGCGSSLGLGADEGVLLVNPTSRDWLWVAASADAAARIDPAPTLPVDESADRRVNAGNSVRIPVERIIEWEAGQGLVLFLYLVPDPVGNEAHLARVLQVSAGELAFHGFRVELR